MSMNNFRFGINNGMSNGGLRGSGLMGGGQGQGGPFMGGAGGPGGASLSAMGQPQPGLPQQGAVLMVYGLNKDKMNADRIFNLLCLYGNIVRVRSRTRFTADPKYCDTAIYILYNCSCVIVTWRKRNERLTFTLMHQNFTVFSWSAVCCVLLLQYQVVFSFFL